MVHVISSVRPLTQPVHHSIRPSRLATTDNPAGASSASGSTGTSSSGSTSGTSTDPGAADFISLFTSHSTGTPGPPAVAQQPPPPAPTAESVFGANPWMSNPTGIAPNGQTYGYNPYYFATQKTAQQVAQMVGGTVVTANQFTPGGGGGFMQQQPNYMVQLPDGRMINPGLVASFYDHGYPQSYVDMMVACEVKNA